MLFRVFILSLSSLVLFSGCKQEIIEKPFYPRNDHEAYWYSLKKADLLNTALGKDWMLAADKPFNEQIFIDLPYQESFDISPKLPDAHGYRFDVKRGQQIVINIDLLTPDTTRVFVDLFRVKSDSLGEYLQVASADSLLDLTFQPRRDASYLLRLQPELLRGGKFSITIENKPTLAFPVAGKDKRAIGSVFGDARDGGRRVHHGVDIFAKRHTPIIAPIKADVRFVGTRGIGGKVIWLRDRKTGNNLYFAHLQDQLVKRYETVYPGDTIGTVGNTGNARTTPPHLHFGIYNNGPFDPYHFIVPAYDDPAFTPPETNNLGNQLVLKSPLILKSQMRPQAKAIDTLDSDEIVILKAINHQYARVETVSGIKGFLRKEDIGGL